MPIGFGEDSTMVGGESEVVGTATAATAHSRRVTWKVRRSILRQSYFVGRYEETLKNNNGLRDALNLRHIV